RSSGSARLSFVPRVAILGSLAAATTVVPLNGPPTSPANAEEAIEYGASDVLDVLMDSGGDEGEVEAESLAADPLAGVRAAVTAGRSGAREIPVCSTEAGNANGSAAAAEISVDTPELIMPLAEGTYRITSRYGYRSLWGRYAMHSGLDLAASAGT